MPEKLTADVARERDVLTEEVDIQGTEYEIEVRDITLGELREYEQQEAEGELTEDEVIQVLWDEYLETPDVDPDDVPMSKTETITRAMYRAWGATDADIDRALDEYQVPGGN